MLPNLNPDPDLQEQLWPLGEIEKILTYLWPYLDNDQH